MRHILAVEIRSKTEFDYIAFHGGPPFFLTFSTLLTCKIRATFGGPAPGSAGRDSGYGKTGGFTAYRDDFFFHASRSLCLSVCIKKEVLI